MTWVSCQIDRLIMRKRGYIERLARGEDGNDFIAPKDQVTLNQARQRVQRVRGIINRMTPNF